MVYFIGAGAGDPELLTIKGKRLIDHADVIIYAGSLVNPAVFQDRKPEAQVYDSAGMTLEEVLDVMQQLRRSVMVDIAPEQALHLLSCRRAPDLTSVRDCTKRFSVQTELLRAFLRRTETVCLLPDDPARQETAQPPEEQACAADSRQYRKQEPFSHPCTQ